MFTSHGKDDQAEEQYCRSGFEKRAGCDKVQPLFALSLLIKISDDSFGQRPGIRRLEFAEGFFLFVIDVVAHVRVHN